MVKLTHVANQVGHNQVGQALVTQETQVAGSRWDRHWYKSGTEGAQRRNETQVGQALVTHRHS